MQNKQPITYRFLPSPAQLDILEDILARVASVFVLAGGRQFGKSILAQMAMCIFALSKPRQFIAFFAPTVKQSKRIYREIIESKGFRATGAKSAAYPTPWIRFPNGSRIEFFALENGGGDRTRGIACDLLVCDEVRDVQENVFKLVLSPMVSARRGIMLLLSTFKSREHWYTRLFDAGQKPNAAGIKSYKRPSTLGYKFHGPDGEKELVRQRALVGETAFKVEFMCEPLGTGDLVFKPEFISNCTRGQLKTASTLPCVVAVDLGKIHDPTSLHVVDADGNVLHEEVFQKGENYIPQTDRIARIAKQYGNAPIVVETNGTTADSIVDFMTPRVHPCPIFPIRMMKHTKESLFNQLRLRMETKRIAIPAECIETIRQLSNLEYRGTRDYIKFVNPNGHDDLAVSLALAVEALEKGYLSSLSNSYIVPESAIVMG